ncbi:hypothetical protein MUP95_03980, partial [bacterium]|nr:hypothetical protein [bacterium]
MILEPGGRADKLGNRYEAIWVIKQMLRLLKEEIHSMQIEAIGDDEKGVDLWVTNKDQTREAQQCKIGNSQGTSWTMSQLINRGIVDYLSCQLKRFSNSIYKLISSSYFHTIDSICERARTSNNKPHDFYQFQILGSNKNIQTEFQKLCDYLKLDLQKEKDLSTIYNFLQRSNFITYPFNEEIKEELLGGIGYHVTGSSSTVFAVLRDFAEDKNNMGNEIFSDKLWEYLKEKDFHPRLSSNDTRVAPAVNKLLNQFEENFKSNLIADKLIHREETDLIIDALEEDKSNIIFIHGNAGFGKSGVLYELISELKEKEVPVLPIRLDIKIPKNNPKEFGISLGLPEWPVICLTGLAGQRKSVIILDQLDALRWTSVHNVEALDIC